MMPFRAFGAEGQASGKGRASGAGTRFEVKGERFEADIGTRFGVRGEGIAWAMVWGPGYVVRGALVTMG
jgi:hypothetical protein